MYVSESFVIQLYEARDDRFSRTDAKLRKQARRVKKQQEAKDSETTTPQQPKNVVLPVHRKVVVV